LLPLFDEKFIFTVEEHEFIAIVSCFVRVLQSTDNDNAYVCSKYYSSVFQIALQDILFSETNDGMYFIITSSGAPKIIETSTASDRSTSGGRIRLSKAQRKAQKTSGAQADVKLQKLQSQELRFVEDNKGSEARSKIVSNYKCTSPSLIIQVLSDTRLIKVISSLDYCLSQLSIFSTLSDSL